MMLHVILACDALRDMLEQKEESEHEQFIVYDYEGKNIVRKASFEFCVGIHSAIDTAG